MNLLYNGEIRMNRYGGVRNSSELRCSPFGPLSRRICGSLMLAQISPYGETSHILGALSEIAGDGIKYENSYRV